MQTTFYDYGPGTNSEKFVIPYIRRVNNPDVNMSMDEIFGLKKGITILYNGAPLKVLRTTANIKNKGFLQGAKRILTIGESSGGSRKTRKNRQTRKSRKN
jgi:hypothetical protein